MSLLPFQAILRHEVVMTKIHYPNNGAFSYSKQEQGGHVLLMWSATFENAIVDYVIGGNISLRGAGEPRFQQLLVCSLTDGYVPPSTCTILQRTVELFNIAQPLIAKFLCNLNVRISLTMDG